MCPVFRVMSLYFLDSCLAPSSMANGKNTNRYTVENFCKELKIPKDNRTQFRHEILADLKDAYPEKGAVDNLTRDDITKFVSRYLASSDTFLLTCWDHLERHQREQQYSRLHNKKLKSSLIKLIDLWRKNLRTTAARKSSQVKTPTMPVNTNVAHNHRDSFSGPETSLSATRSPTYLDRPSFQQDALSPPAKTTPHEPELYGVEGPSHLFDDTSDSPDDVSTIPYHQENDADDEVQITGHQQSSMVWGPADTRFFMSTAEPSQPSSAKGKEIIREASARGDQPRSSVQARAGSSSQLPTRGPGSTAATKRPYGDIVHPQAESTADSESLLNNKRCKVAEDVTEHSREEDARTKPRPQAVRCNVQQAPEFRLTDPRCIIQLQVIHVDPVIPGSQKVDNLVLVCSKNKTMILDTNSQEKYFKYLQESENRQAEIDNSSTEDASSVAMSSSALYRRIPTALRNMLTGIYL